MRRRHLTVSQFDSSTWQYALVPAAIWGIAMAAACLVAWFEPAPATPNVAAGPASAAPAGASGQAPALPAPSQPVRLVSEGRR